ncbi:hypothetical protein BCO18430_04428 [Burkholderia contaminans]|nr:hypothetical protein BCO18430_04428 [Burkholderia contaminans]
MRCAIARIHRAAQEDAPLMTFRKVRHDRRSTHTAMASAA